MPYLTEFLTVAVIHLLAVISPGPDFILITKNSLVHSRKVGIHSAIGLGLGILVHVAYSLVGIGFIISQSILLFSFIKLLGAGYLIYIGYKALRSHPTPASEAEHAIDEVKREELSTAQAIKMGFITNVTNPKATLFFFSLFTQVINPATPVGIQLLYGIEMAVVTGLWFAFVAIMFSQKWLSVKLAKAQGYIDKVMGAILIALGVKIAYSQAK